MSKAKSNYNADDQELYAKMSKLAFIRGKNKRNTFMKKNGLSGDGWEIDNQLSDKKNTVLHNSRTGETVLSVRGTELNHETATKAEDLMNDGLLAFGLEKAGSRYRQSERKLIQINEKYGDDSNISITGASLGGRIAADLSTKYDLEAHVFNPGSSPIEVIEPVASKGLLPGPFGGAMQKEIHKSNSKVHTYRVGSDLISASHMLGNHDNTHVIAKKVGARNSHSIDNFYENRSGLRGEHLGSIRSGYVQPPVQDIRNISLIKKVTPVHDVRNIQLIKRLPTTPAAPVVKPTTAPVGITQ